MRIYTIYACYPDQSVQTFKIAALTPALAEDQIRRSYDLPAGVVVYRGF